MVTNAESSSQDGQMRSKKNSDTAHDKVVKVKPQQQKQRHYQRVRSNIYIHGGKLLKPPQLQWVLEVSVI